MSVTFSFASTASRDGEETARYHLLVLPAASLARMHQRDQSVLAGLDAKFGGAAPAPLPDASTDHAYDDILRHMTRVYHKSGARFILLCVRLPGEARVSYELYARCEAGAWKYFPTVYARGHHNTLDVPVMSVAEFRHIAARRSEGPEGVNPHV